MFASIIKPVKAMALRSILNAKQWTIVKSAPDGLCLLHSVKSSLKYQLRRNVDLEELKCVVFSESVNNVERYLPTVGNKLAYIKQLNSYLIHKQYSHALGDVVPNILASGLNLRINILDVRGNLVRETLIKPFDESAISEISIKLQNEHYDGIAPKKDYISATPASAPLCNDVSLLSNDVAFCDVAPPSDVALLSNDVASCDDVAPLIDVAPLACDSDVESTSGEVDAPQRRFYTADELRAVEQCAPSRRVRRRIYQLGLRHTQPVVHNTAPSLTKVTIQRYDVPRLCLTNPTSITNKMDELFVITKE